MKATLSPLRNIIEVCDDEFATADEQCETLVAGDPMVKRLTTLPGIGPDYRNRLRCRLGHRQSLRTGGPGDQLSGVGAARVQLR